jgi:putative SOS response-associated peptidase YedK
LQPSYNVAPTREVPAVVSGGEGCRLEVLRWSLIPSWADDPRIGSRAINARSETVAEKPSFRRAFKKSRCLMLADGFYEWRKENGGKQPYYVWMKNGGPFAFAGLWESWNKDEGGGIHSCAIITTDANDLMTEIHYRMPVIMPPEYYELWLDPAVREPEELLPLLEPFPAADMEAYPISLRVNSPSNDGPDCVERAA